MGASFQVVEDCGRVANRIFERQNAANRARQAEAHGVEIAAAIVAEEAAEAAQEKPWSDENPRPKFYAEHGQETGLPLGPVSWMPMGDGEASSILACAAHDGERQHTGVLLVGPPRQRRNHHH